jgi:hypothetical protein
MKLLVRLLRVDAVLLGCRTSGYSQSRCGCLSKDERCHPKTRKREAAAVSRSRLKKSAGDGALLPNSKLDTSTTLDVDAWEHSIASRKKASHHHTPVQSKQI